jgi:tetratricopeptide (TPR) repeat protein
LIFPESVIGAAAMLAPIVVCPWLGFAAWRKARRRAYEPQGFEPVPARVDTAPLVALGAAWIVVSYLPVSNILVLLPTVRAERFWYFPAVGSAILLGVGFAQLLRAPRGTPRHVLALAAVMLFAGFQCAKARLHALDYENDLTFWNATRKAVPRSAKAHLNYSVMLGARGDLQGRLESNAVALTLAPKWPMASVYLGDTLCRLHRSEEALPHYLEGFELGPADMGLVALGLQCLWDEKQLDAPSKARGELQDLADRFPGSWLKYLVDDTLANGDEYQGVNPKYRPRGYNEGPKKD